MGGLNGATHTVRFLLCANFDTVAMEMRIDEYVTSRGTKGKTGMLTFNDFAYLILNTRSFSPEMYIS